MSMSAADALRRTGRDAGIRVNLPISGTLRHTMGRIQPVVRWRSEGGFCPIYGANSDYYDTAVFHRNAHRRVISPIRYPLVGHGVFGGVDPPASSRNSVAFLCDEVAANADGLKVGGR